MDVSFIEIYNDKIYDLLAGKEQLAAFSTNILNPAT